MLCTRPPSSRTRSTPEATRTLHMQRPQRLTNGTPQSFGPVFGKTELTTRAFTPEPQRYETFTLPWEVRGGELCLQQSLPLPPPRGKHFFHESTYLPCWRFVGRYICTTSYKNIGLRRTGVDVCCCVRALVVNTCCCCTQLISPMKHNSSPPFISLQYSACTKTSTSSLLSPRKNNPLGWHGRSLRFLKAPPASTKKRAYKGSARGGVGGGVGGGGAMSYNVPPQTTTTATGFLTSAVNHCQRVGVFCPLSSCASPRRRPLALIRHIGSRKLRHG